MCKVPTPGVSRALLLVGPIAWSLACDNATAPAAHYSRAATVRYTASPSGTIITGRVGAFGSFDDEAFVEFPIDFPSSSPVVINFTISDCCVGPNDTTPFWVALYDGDGTADPSNYGRGILPQEFTHTADFSRNTVDFTIDVTSMVALLREVGATHIGLRFFIDPVTNQLFVDSGAMLEAGP
jgi:hypothetical protein